jgi:hypothetical protein
VGDIEASPTIDESLSDPIQPVRETGPFLLIVRTGQIFTAHDTTPSKSCDMNEYRRMLGVSRI